MQLCTRSNTFDTDTALKVFSRDNGLPPKQVDFRRETLYRTRGGALFLHIEGLADNPIARKVKLADLEHNSDLSRLPEVTERDLKRVEKYKRAIDLLKSR